MTYSENMQKNIFFIIGMHRSGTSLFTRLCNLAGMGLEAGNFVPALPNDNETGFWELEEVVTLNESIFEQYGFSHLNADILPPHWQGDANFTQLRVQINALMSKGVNQYPLFAIKDPRLCRTLPIWLQSCEELSLSPKILFSVRNPLEVAMSLHKRNHISVEQGLQLWQRYNEEALAHTAHLPRFVVHFPTVTSQWQQSLTQAAESLHFNWSQPLEQIEQDIARFIRPELQHHAFEATYEQDARVSSEIRALYADLQQQAIVDSHQKMIEPKGAGLLSRLYHKITA